MNKNIINTSKTLAFYFNKFQIKAWLDTLQKHNSHIQSIKDLSYISGIHDKLIFLVEDGFISGFIFDQEKQNTDFEYTIFLPTPAEYSETIWNTQYFPLGVF